MTDAPRLLLTRPRADCARLLEALGPEAPAAIVSPLVEIIADPAPVDAAGLVGVVLTSANALGALPDGALAPGLTAFCVGRHTAEAARHRGLAAQSADGDADDLVTLIVRSGTAGPLLHLHGAHTRGNVARRLAAAGITCRAQIIYHQAERPLTSEALSALGAGSPLVVPLFSPRTARLFARAGPFAAPLHVVAMSRAVAEATEPLGPRSIVYPARPDLDAMVAALRDHFGRSDEA